MTYHNTGQIQPEILWGLSKSENLRKGNQHINCDFIDALFQLPEALKKNKTMTDNPHIQWKDFGNEWGEISKHWGSEFVE